MLLFIFIVATLNLAVGYAIGAGLTSLDDLMGLLRRSKPTKVEDLAPIDQEPLSKVESVDDQEKHSQEDLIAGLASFREKLTNASLELKLSQEDPERFEDCATRLQTVNHDYIEHTNEVIEHLDDEGASKSSREELAKNADDAKQISGRIDKILENPIDEDTKHELLTASEAMRDNASTVEKAAVTVSEETASEEAAEQDQTDEASVESPAKDPPAQAEPEAQTEEKGVEPAQEVAQNDDPEAQQPSDKAEEAEASSEADASAASTEEELFYRVENDLAVIEKDKSLFLVEFRLDEVGEESENSEVMFEASKGLSVAIHKSLAANQPFTQLGRRIAYLEDDNYDDAVSRMLRVQEALTAVPIEGEEEPTQATCCAALVEARSGEGRDTLLERLKEALDEAAKTGPNTAFHHDGAIPTQVSGEAAAPAMAGA